MDSSKVQLQLQAEIERLFYSLNFIRGENKEQKRSKIMEEIRRLQAFSDSLTYNPKKTEKGDKNDKTTVN